MTILIGSTIKEPCVFCTRTVVVPATVSFRWAVCSDCAVVDPDSELPVLEIPDGTYLDSVDQVFVVGGHVCDHLCDPG